MNGNQTNTIVKRNITQRTITTNIDAYKVPIYPAKVVCEAKLYLCVCLCVCVRALVCASPCVREISALKMISLKYL